MTNRKHSDQLPWVSEVPVVPLLIYAEGACTEQLWGLGCIPECFHYDCSVNLDVYIMVLDFSVVVMLTHPAKIWRMRWGPVLFLPKCASSRQDSGELLLFFIDVHAAVSCIRNCVSSVIKTGEKSEFVIDETYFFKWQVFSE